MERRNNQAEDIETKIPGTSVLLDLINTSSDGEESSDQGEDN